MSSASKKNFFKTVDYQSSEDEEVVLKKIERKQNRQKAFDTSDPEVQARLKRQEPYNKKLKVIMDKFKIFDYNGAFNELNSLCNEFEKAKSTVEKDGYTPVFFKALIDIEEGIEGLTSKEKNRLSKESKNALSKLKQKARKLAEEFQAQVDEVRKNGVDVDIEESSSSEVVEESSESEQKSERKSSSSSSSKSSKSEEDSDSENWDNQNEEQKVVEVVKNRAALSREERRKFWLKTPEEIKKVQETKAKREQVVKTTERSYKIQEVNFDFSGVSLQQDSIARRLKELGSTKTQMGADKLHQNINMLLYILNNTQSPKPRLEVLIMILNLKTEFFRLENTILERQTWLEFFDYIQEYMKTLMSGASFLEKEVTSYLKPEEDKYTLRELENLLISQLNFLDNEWLIMIKNSDPESFEYANFLRDEMELVRLLLEALGTFEKRQDGMTSCAHLALRLLEHVYFISDNTLDNMAKICPDYVLVKQPKGLVERLTRHIYNKIKDTALTAKTGLLEAFNHAVNDRMLEAKDLLLMFNLPEKPIPNDPTLAFYFNRALAAVGLCAFRKGNPEACQELLEEMCCSGKLRDLLNQTSVKGYTEMTERRNLIPYHMSLSLEAIESVYFISVMLNEAPSLIAQLNGDDRKPSSKLFQKLWQFYEKNPLSGPPENHRDTIYCAVKELLKGEWKKCFSYVCQLKLWNRMFQVDQVKQRYEQLIKRQAFKTFISSIKNSFHVLKFERLAELFDTPANSLVSFTCEMIFSGEISAKLDPKSGCLVTGRRELNELESISEKAGQKIYSLMGINEKLFDVKFSDVNFSELIGMTDPAQLRSQKRGTTKTTAVN
jgi:translation initiation factor 3 subunit C